MDLSDSGKPSRASAKSLRNVQRPSKSDWFPGASRILSNSRLIVWNGLATAGELSSRHLPDFIWRVEVRVRFGLWSIFTGKYMNVAGLSLVLRRILQYYIYPEGCTDRDLFLYA